ncbi:MAG TPA: ATP-binding protein, partial [Gammaproteobacteria bacterium]|nr:ATP-binding protein [Gammaproteobacteria bacterium]
MTLERSHDYLLSLLRELVSLPSETEWVEFKHNNDDPKQIGEYISGLANSAALLGKQSAYLVWGIEDEQHEVVGTTFNPSSARHKQQELESWLLQKTAPKIDFHFYEFDSAQALPVVILEIQAASHTPVQFDGIEYIRVGSYKKRLREFAEKERALWRVFDQVSFERQLAAEN